MDTRIESLLKSLERNHHRFKETFIDEDTGDRSCVTRVDHGVGSFFCVENLDVRE